MKNAIASTGRAAFVGFLFTLGAYASAEGLLSRSNARVGLSDCGDAANPCMLETLHVTAERDARLVSTPESPEPAERVTLSES